MKRLRYAFVFSILFLASASILKISEWIEPGFSYSKVHVDETSSGHAFGRLSKTLYHIQEQYADPDRVNPKEMLKKVLYYLSLSVAEVTVEYPSASSSTCILKVKDAKKEILLDLRNVFALKATVADAVKFVIQNKISDVKIDELETVAINAILATLDPHSQYLSKETYEETKVGTSGQFGGLGIVIGIRDAILTIISPLEDTPAFKAGLRAGDQITKIGDEATENILLEEAVKKMRGPKGTPVNLTVMRKNWTQPKDFRITRDIINIVSIESEILDNKIGYLKIKAFQEDTTASAEKHLAKLHSKAGGRLSGLILDLRNNPGGLLEQAIGISDLFLEKGVIVSTVGPKNKVLEEDRAQESGTEPDYPIIILTNIGSASASEIVAGALQKNKRAIVLGERTFGKGTVQQLFSLPPDSALKLTISKYLTAGSTSIQNTGIVPEIRTLPSLVKKDVFDIVENTSTFREDQLDGHFTQELQEPPKKSELQVSYFTKGQDDETVEYTGLSPSDSPEKRAEKLLSDFDIRFSTKVLAESKGPSPKDLLKSAEKLIKTVEKEEMDKISQALSKQKVDWSTDKPSQSNCDAPKISWQYSSERKPVAVLSAGKKYSLQLTAENGGACTFYQVKAVTRSKTYFFSDHEFIFGKLMPRQTASREVNVEIPKSSPDGLYPVEVLLSDAHKIKEKILNVEVPIEAAQSPIFGFSYKTSQALEPGKGFDIIFNVKNVGKAATERATISIKPEEGSNVSIKRNRMPIAGLKPNETKTFAFQVDVPPTFSQEELRLNLEISDYAYRSFVNKKISLMRESKPVVKETLNHPPTIVINNERDLLKPIGTDTLNILGSIKDQAMIKDMYVLVNQKKILYKNFETGGKSPSTASFEKKIELEKGENQVSIVVRNEDDLLGKKNYIIYRTSKN